MSRSARRISCRSVATQSRRVRVSDLRREYSYEEFGQCYDGFWRQLADGLKTDIAQPEYWLNATVAYAVASTPVERSVSKFVDYDFLPVAES